MQQIIPPITNAFAIFAARLCFGVMDSTYSLYAWSRTFLSAPYDTLDKFFCFCSSDVLAELLCLVVGCAMVVPPVYFPLIGIVCQIFSIFIRSFFCALYPNFIITLVYLSFLCKTLLNIFNCWKAEKDLKTTPFRPVFHRQYNFSEVIEDNRSAGLSKK